MRDGILEDEALKLDLFQAYYDARKHKRNTINQLKFEVDFEQKLFLLYEEIINRSYKPKPSICFIVNKPVKREVFAADFQDRVIHHLLYNYISPVLEQSFIEDSYSCRKGKGTLYGIKRVDQFVKECSANYTKDCYILKLDIQGYFMSINKDILFSQLKELLDERNIEKAYAGMLQPDWDMIFYLIQEIIFQDVREDCSIKGFNCDWDGLPLSKSLFHTPIERGLPIGNLTSQLFSNVYMHVFDKYMKSELKLEYYGRYVDDFVIVHSDQDYLKEVIRLIKSFLEEKLALNIHPKKIYLQHYTKGVASLGAVIKPNRLYIGKRTLCHFKECIYHFHRKLSSDTFVPNTKELKMMRAAINCYLGVMQHYKCYNIKKRVLFNKNLSIFEYGYFTESIKKYRLSMKKDEEISSLNCMENINEL